MVPDLSIKKWSEGKEDLIERCEIYAYLHLHTYEYVNIFWVGELHVLLLGGVIYKYVL